MRSSSVPSASVRMPTAPTAWHHGVERRSSASGTGLPRVAWCSMAPILVDAQDAVDAGDGGAADPPVGHRASTRTFRNRRSRVAPLARHVTTAAADLRAGMRSQAPTAALPLPQQSSGTPSPGASSAPRRRDRPRAPARIRCAGGAQRGDDGDRPISVQRTDCGRIGEHQRKPARPDGDDLCGRVRARTCRARARRRRSHRRRQLGAAGGASTEIRRSIPVPSDQPQHARAALWRSSGFAGMSRLSRVTPTVGWPAGAGAA
jgi:hypothetical protein